MTSTSHRWCRGDHPRRTAPHAFRSGLAVPVIVLVAGRRSTRLGRGRSCTAVAIVRSSSPGRRSSCAARRRWTPRPLLGGLTDKPPVWLDTAGAAAVRSGRGIACPNGRSVPSPTRRWARSTSRSGASATCRRLVPLGARRRRRHLRRVLRLELRSGHRRVRRPADRRRAHGGHVLRPRATRSPRCRRRSRTRAAPTRSPGRRWVRGAGSSPAWPRTWSTSSRRPSSSARSAC